MPRHFARLLSHVHAYEPNLQDIDTSTPPANRTLDALFAPLTVTKGELKSRMVDVHAELDRMREELHHAQQAKDDAEHAHANHVAAAEAEINVLASKLAKARVDQKELSAITEEAVSELEQHHAARLAEETPPHLKCPIEMARFRSPVIVSDGHSFERAAIKRWLAAHDTNPVTGAHLAHHDLVSNLGLRDASVAWAAEHRPDEQRADAEEHRGAWTPSGTSGQVQRGVRTAPRTAAPRTALRTAPRTAPRTVQRTAPRAAPGMALGTAPRTMDDGNASARGEALVAAAMEDGGLRIFEAYQALLLEFRALSPTPYA